MENPAIMRPSAVQTIRSATVYCYFYDFKGQLWMCGRIRSTLMSLASFRRDTLSAGTRSNLFDLRCLLLQERRNLAVCEYKRPTGSNYCSINIPVILRPYKICSSVENSRGGWRWCYKCFNVHPTVSDHQT